MKEENGKSRAMNKRTYLYVALGCAAILLALVVIVTSVALANKGGNELKKPSEIITPVEPDEPSKPSNSDDPSKPDDEPVSGENNTFLAPVAEVSAINGYGFYHNKTLNNYYVHTGIDYAGEEGTEVFASQDGKIEGIYTSDVLVGTRIVIDHGDGVKSVYEFVEAKEGLKAGDEVKRGDVIATIAAATGNEYKDGAHVHFEVWEKGEAVDPSKFFTAEEK